MSKAFAEKIIDSMVDENGHCGERGLSPKQFTIITDAMTDHTTDEHDAGYWQGDYASINFWSIYHTGNVGKYRVTVNEHKHFNIGYNVVEIRLRDKAELEAEAEAEAERQRLRELLRFENGEYVAEPKKRIDLELTLLRDYECYGRSYSYYDDGEFHIYTFTDSDGNCFVLKTKKLLMADVQNDDGTWDDTVAEVGSKVTMRATIKEHSEYRGVRQNVINRPRIFKVA